MAPVNRLYYCIAAAAAGMGMGMGTQYELAYLYGILARPTQ